MISSKRRENAEIYSLNDLVPDFLQSFVFRFYVNILDPNSAVQLALLTHIISGTHLCHQCASPRYLQFIPGALFVTMHVMQAMLKEIFEFPSKQIKQETIWEADLIKHKNI